MTLRDRERQTSGARLQAQAMPVRAPGAFLSRLAVLNAQATPLKLRPRQRVALTPAQDDLVFVVRSGVISLRTAMTSSGAGLISLFFPGDVVSSGSVPCFLERMLVASAPAEVLRFKTKSLLKILASDPELLAAYETQRERQLARASLHAAMLATLDGPQRLAGYLVEMALEVGIASGQTIAIDLPLTRTETAQHLALNADTLSRLMSRFKADGLVSQKSRQQITLRNWRALADLCPISPAIVAIERNRLSPLV